MTIQEQTASGTGRKAVRFGIFLSLGQDAVVSACREVAEAELVPIADLPGFVGAVADLDGLVLQNGSFTKDVAAALSKSPRIRWVQSAATGVDAFQRHGLPPGVQLTNAGEVWAPSVADHAMALLLGVLRNLPQLERDRQAHRWDRGALAGSLGGLHGRNLLMVGLGPIGHLIAQRAHGFDVHVTALTRSPERARATPAIEKIEPLDRLLPCLAEADAVILALPLVSATRHLIGREALAAMRPDAVLVNVGRGDLVDEAALIEALTRGALRGVGLDVAAAEPLPAASPLWGFERVLISPHAAGFDDGPALARLGALCRSNLQRYIAGEALLGRVEPAPR
jgi:phosphoglycerate dehydrogenase-like enzyme